jgi:hypothetical protein
VSMNDPETGQMICDHEQLKQASIDYLSNLLKNREPKEDYRENFETLRILHDSRMNEELENDEELTKEDFQNMLKKLKRKKAAKYKFLLNGGESYQNAIFCLYKKKCGNQKKNKEFGNILSVQCSSRVKALKVNFQIRDLYILKMKFRNHLKL